MPQPVTTIEELHSFIQCHPLIDNHAHPLLLPGHASHYPLESITSEAHGPALQDTRESLAHMRAVKYLASHLNCAEDWDVIKKRRAAIDAEEWNKRCFQGVQCVLMDDGLDQDTVEPYKAHDRLTTAPTKRIVRIEKVAEDLLLELRQLPEFQTKKVYQQLDLWLDAWAEKMKAALGDSEVAGFKSVICYRSGLDVDLRAAGTPDVLNAFAELLEQAAADEKSCRIDNKVLNDQLVKTLCSMLQTCPDHQRKPVQFHTGLGDNDIQLLKANPAHLEPVLRKYSKVPIVLLHSSYPYTREAGYLATVYQNAYLDFGEVFPMLSHDGQKSIIKEMLEQTPGTKLLWSSDGHWFPETYILANAQIREVLSEVLLKRVKRGDLSLEQATRLTENLLFENSNRLYNLGLSPSFSPSTSPPPRYKSPEALTNGVAVPALPEYQPVDVVTTFLEENPRTKFIRFIWTDYVAVRRLRVLPISSLKRMLAKGSNVSITKAAFSLLQNDYPSADSSATGMYDVIPDWSSLTSCEGYAPGHASVQCFIRTDPETDAPICPRAALSRAVNRAKTHGMEFLVGFETEVTFFNQKDGGEYETLESAHAWSATFALTPRKAACLDEIAIALEESGIELLMYHPESCVGQYEFVTGPLPPIEAVDALTHVRETIEKICCKHGMRATLHPKPVLNQTGNAAHCHISLTKGRVHEDAFFGGVLNHLRALTALGMSTDVSYQRLQDNCWAGGTWVCWGNENREAPLRRISKEEAHWEIRGVDGTANPFLFLAGVVAAGVSGVERGARLPRSCEANPAALSEAERKEYALTERIPRSLKEALAAFLEDKVLGEMLGKEVVEKFRHIKEAEMAFVAKLDLTHGKDGWKWFLERY